MRIGWLERRLLRDEQAIACANAKRDSAAGPTKRARGGVGSKIARLIARTAETLCRNGGRREPRDWERWVHSLTPELLNELPETAAEVKRRMFRANVTRVEIETRATCNRICSFCPNTIMDRRMNSTLADAKMLDRVFDELGSIDYQRQIRVARYLEPST